MIILGLGSNLNDKLNYLKQAIELIQRDILSNSVISSFYESPALLPENAPSEWDIPYLNAAIKGETSLSAQELLIKVKHIEEQLGRQHRGIWGPREIDIDILAYHDMVIDTPDLHIPHTHLHNRLFALLPLAEIVPDWIHPILQFSAKELALKLHTQHPEAIFKTSLTLS